MNLSLYLSYIATVVAFLITPGPVTIMVIRQCQGQLRNALLVVLGTNTASVIYIIISLLIMSGLMGLNEQYLNWLQALGALYLIYLGIQGLRDLDPPEADAVPRLPAGHLLKSSFLLGLSNPKDIIFFMSFFPAFLKITPVLSHSALILTLTWILIDYSILISVGLLASKLYTPRRARIINLISAVAFVVIGLVALGYACRDLIA